MFTAGYLATSSWSNVALIDLTTGLTVDHLPQGSLITALEVNPAGDLLAFRRMVDPDVALVLVGNLLVLIRRAPAVSPAPLPAAAQSGK